MSQVIVIHPFDLLVDDNLNILNRRKFWYRDFRILFNLKTWPWFLR